MAIRKVPVHRTITYRPHYTLAKSGPDYSYLNSKDNDFVHCKQTCKIPLL